MSTRAYSHRFCQSVAAAWTMLMRIEDSTRQKSWRKRKVSTLPWKKCSGIIGIIESTTSKHNLSASQHDPLPTIEMSDPFCGSSCSTCPDTSLASCFMRCRGCCQVTAEEKRRLWRPASARGLAQCHKSLSEKTS